MITQPRPGGDRRSTSRSAVLTVLAALSLASACDKVPLLAPSGTVITLFPSATSVPVNGSVEIVATVIENGTTAPPPTNPGNGNGNGSTTPTTGTTTSQSGSGTPVHNGTVVSFTTTLGRVEPSEARTQNGQVRVRLITSGESGSATITAFSGGASARLENFPVGAAAAERIIISATNQNLPASGGSTQVQARLETSGGAPIAGVPVTFTTTSGSVTPTTAITDEQGIARTTLTTTAAAKVTATAGSKTGTVDVGVAERSGLAVTASPQATTVGNPVTFSIATAAGRAVTNARINYGDGTSDELGTVAGTQTASHVYSAPGNYRVTVTADNGESTGTSVSVGSLTVTLNTPPTTPPNTPVAFTASVPAGTQARAYRWSFGDGTTVETTGPQVSHPYTQRGSYAVSVDVIGLNGGVIGRATTSVTIAGL